MTTIAPSRAPPSAGNANANGTLSSHPFTCNTCQVAFRNSELQRTHMRSDWHRYNLKRRVASLPPLSSETFTEKVLSAQATSNEAAAKASYEKLCHACSRVYYSENAYQNHLQSQKHKARVVAMQIGTTDDEVSSVLSSTFSLGEPINKAPPSESADSEAEREFSQVVEGIKDASVTDEEPLSRRPSRPHHSAGQDRPEDRPEDRSSSTATPSSTSAPPAPADLVQRACLFCSYISPSLNLNVLHMEKIHGMFIPERSFLVDIQGLVTYLQTKISDLHECLFCGKLKTTASAIQTHMRDKGHCMIAFESEAEMIEVGQFYDFRGTYSDGEEDEDDEAMEEDGTRGEGDGWETDSSASSLDSAELTAVPIDQTPKYERLSKHLHHSSRDPRPHRHADGWHSHAHKAAHAAYYSDYELHLPSGRAVGHRSLNKYYKQNLHNYPSQATIQAEERRAAIEDGAEPDRDDQQVQTHERGRRGREIATRANGGLGMLGVSDEKKREVQAVEKRERRRAHRDQQRQQWITEKKANSQKHFRDPLLQ